MPLRRRLGRRLPPLGRVVALLGAAALAGGLVALLDGPWLRVADVAWAGDRYTDADDLARVLEPRRGASLLTVDTGELVERLSELPAVAEVRVEAVLPDRIEATVVEREPALVWQTSGARLIGDSDGTLFSATAPDAPLADDLVGLPIVDDQRAEARVTRVGDVVPDGLVDVALRLAALDPAALGSTASAISVRLDDRHGFSLVADDADWRIVFGLYGHDPDAASGAAAARIERQVTAVRTLFANEVETQIGWVDARNPGKVYFRAKG